jgi:hypothetical protein
MKIGRRKTSQSFFVSIFIFQGAGSVLVEPGITHRRIGPEKVSVGISRQLYSFF